MKKENIDVGTNHTPVGAEITEFIDTDPVPLYEIGHKKEVVEHPASAKTKFELQPLPYPSDALEPFIDERTMEIHHERHHGTYVNNLNIALEGNEDVPKSIEEIIKNISKYSSAVRNNGGGHYNHVFFWKLLKPNGGGQPKGELMDAIKSAFGSFENFKNKFSEAATKLFGSGWVWLVKADGELQIGTTPNQDNPLMDISDFKGQPILCLDVWEHAYYLKYKNRRIDYINNWWNIINWKVAEENFQNAEML